MDDDSHSPPPYIALPPRDDQRIPDDDMDLLAAYEDAVVASHQHSQIQTRDADDDLLHRVDALILQRELRRLRLAILDRMESSND